MATTPTSEMTDGPVLSLITKRLRALKKKQNRILQMEESIAQGKPINKEQEDVLRSKPFVSAAIDELEKLRQPLSVALSEEIELAAHRLNPKSESSVVPEASNEMLEDLLHLLYFGSLFDVKPQNDFTATMLTRTHERGCCLTYDYVTDDATDLLGERDLDMISMLGCLLISRPGNTSLSHKNALQRCMEHAKLWLANSDQPIDSTTNVSYAELRERLNKIMASDYFTTTPEMKAPVEVAAAAGNYVPFQVPFSVPVQVDDSVAQYQPKGLNHGCTIYSRTVIDVMMVLASLILNCKFIQEQETESFQQETGDEQSSSTEEPQKDEQETVNLAEVVLDQEEQDKPSTEVEVDHNQRELEPEKQYVNRRFYQNPRGGRGGGNGGRRGYSNGRGGRSGGRGVGGYQNGRNQYYDQPGNFHQRNYYNNRGRGGRGGGHTYNTGQSGHAPADAGVES
ncbi:GLYCINE-RICH PROTEIN [Salix purpurea]|uniref:GLYCINE-RICH PROTEIN n=1 Tax=Salix purpurea TaxID=77065 RepID=A0A9Q0Z323_SALPP|nr:GLYCINE-RICH PROTEIN [Salix purpurea]